MKMHSTIIAAAALLAGISVANAQMSTTSPSSSTGASSGSSMSGSSQQATGTGQYCLEASPGGALNCKYASLAACQKDAKVQNQNCTQNPKSGTTGSR